MIQEMSELRSEIASLRAESCFLRSAYLEVSRRLSNQERDNYKLKVSFLAVVVCQVERSVEE